MSAARSRAIRRLSRAFAKERVIRGCEWAAGWLLVVAYELRWRRGGLEDAHELRHIAACVEAGNTDDCDPRRCKLDRTPAWQHGETGDILRTYGQRA